MRQLGRGKQTLRKLVLALGAYDSMKLISVHAHVCLSHTGKLPLGQIWVQVPVSYLLEWLVNTQDIIWATHW